MRVKLFWKNEPMKPGAFLGLKPTGKNAEDFEAEIQCLAPKQPKNKDRGYQAVSERR